MSNKVEMNWNLGDLYDSFDSNELKEDFLSLQKYIDVLNDYTKNNFYNGLDVKERLENYIKKSEDVVNVYTKLMSYCYLCYYANLDSKDALGLAGQVDEIYAKYVKIDAAFKKWVKELGGIGSYIENSELLKSYSYYLKSKVHEAEHTLSDKEEYIISSMKNCSSNAWSNLNYEQLSSLIVEVPVNDTIENVSFSTAEAMLINAPKNEKQNIFYSQMKALKSIEDISATCLNNIKQEALLLSKLRGYNSVLEETAAKSKMDLNTLEIAMGKLKENLPLLQRYYKIKAKHLGYSEGLPFYEINNSKINTNKKYTFDDAGKMLIDIYKKFSLSMSKFIEYAFSENWIDSEPRAKKYQGNFCMPLHPIKQIRICTNFNEDLNSVLSLAHELGHGYHFYCMNDEKLFNYGYPLALVETPSIFSTTVAINSLLKTANADEKTQLLQFDLDCIIGDILVMFSRYIFEKDLFKLKHEKTLTASELNDLMICAQKHAFGDSLDKNLLNPYVWISKSQFYNSENNFYNFPYIFGDLLSKGFYAMYLDRGDEFVNRYDKFLSSTGKGDLQEIMKILEIDLNDESFWDKTYKIIDSMINEYLVLTGE